MCVKNIIQIVETAWTVERTYSIRQLQFEDAPRTTFFEDVVHVILEILLTGDPVVVRNGYRHPTQNIFRQSSNILNSQKQLILKKIKSCESR